MGTVTTSSETAFTQSAETVYDFVANPQNWTKTYPGSAHIGKLPELPLRVGDTWEEAGPDGDRIFSWQLAAAVRPSLFVFTSIGRLGTTATATAACRAASRSATGSPAPATTSRCSPAP